MTLLWTLSLALPTCVALALGVLGGVRTTGATRVRDRLVALAAATAVPAGLVAALAETDARLELPWLLLGSLFELDQIARPLLLVASLLYAAALVAVHSSGTDRAAALTGFLLMSFVGNCVVFTAADAATFYVGFAVMSVAAYGLVVHERSRTALRAGRIYLVLTVGSELAVLSALLLVVASGGLLLADAPAAVADSDHTGLIVALLLVGFGTKAGTVPLHVWLPLAHPAAPPPASAVLSGAMIKAGLVGWLRFLPLGELALPGWGLTLVVLALVGAFAALPLGLLQNDAKVALAYSSISQMGFLAVLVGTAMVSPELAPACILASAVYAVHHGLAKGALFLGVTVWRTHGEGWVRWWVIAGLAVASLAVAGAPFGSGAIAKYAAKEAVETASVLGVDLIVLLPLVGTVSTVLLARFGWLLLTGSRDRAWGVDGALLTWSALVVGGLALTWWTAQAWAPVVQVPGLDATTLWDATWPILLGLVLCAVGWWLRSRDLVPAAIRERGLGVIPPGDVVVPEERLLARAGGVLTRADAAAVRGWARLGRSAGVLSRAAEGSLAASARLQDRLEGWRVAGLAVLGAGAALALVAWWWR